MSNRKGRPSTHHKARTRLRKKLRDRGVPEDKIEEAVEALRARQRIAREKDQAVKPVPAHLRTVHLSADRLAAEAETYARLTPDDGKHRPTSPDSLTSGTARATGQTAAAVKRGTTVTKWQHDERETGS